jgi:hypothetical protein
LLLAEEVRSLLHRFRDGIPDPVAYLAHVQLADGGLVIDPLVRRGFPRPTSHRTRGVCSIVVVGHDGAELLDDAGDDGGEDHPTIPEHTTPGLEVSGANGF